MAGTREDTRKTGRGDVRPVEAVPEELRREFEDLGLSPYEARLLLAMLALGQANTLQLAQASGVPRTSIYPVLEGLAAKRLAHRLPADGPAVWAAKGRDEILEQLDAAEQERLRQYRARTERVRSLLAEAFPDEAPVLEPPVRLLYTPAEQRKAYERLAAQTEAEALLFIRRPAPSDAHTLDPVIADLAARVETRVVYESEPAGGSGASPSIAAMQAVRAAGGYARVAEDLPVGLAVFDRQAVLVTFNGTAPGDAPTVALIEDAGMATALAESFKYRWAGGAPCSCHDT